MLMLIAELVFSRSFVRPSFSFSYTYRITTLSTQSMPRNEYWISWIELKFIFICVNKIGCIQYFSTLVIHYLQLCLVSIHTYSTLRYFVGTRHSCHVMLVEFNMDFFFFCNQFYLFSLTALCRLSCERLFVTVFVNGIEFSKNLTRNRWTSLLLWIYRWVRQKFLIFDVETNKYRMRTIFDSIE